MKKILIFTLLLGFGFGVQPPSFGQTAPPPAQNAPAAPKPKPGAAKAKAAKQAARKKKRQQQADSNRQGKRTELTQKYGMNLTQIQQYEALQKTRKEKVDALNKTPGVSGKNRRQKIKAINKEFLASVDQILTPAQRTIATTQRSQKAQQNTQVYPMLKQYRKERQAIRADHNIADHAAALAQLDKKYETALTAMVGEKRAHYFVQKLAHGRNAAQKDVKAYQLSFQDGQKYNGIRERVRKRHNTLDSTTLTHKKRVEREQQIQEKRNEHVKSLLGENNFKQWMRKKNPTFEQKLKQNLNFTDQQINQYKDILNQAAIARVVIKKGKETKEAKQAKIAQLATQTDQKVQKMLTPAQYSKMLEERKKFENSARRKTIQTHTLKPAPKAKPQQPTQ